VELTETIEETHGQEEGMSGDVAGARKAGGPNPVDLWIGRRVRKRRRELRMSMQELGGLLGITLQQVHKYETGGTRVSGSRLFDLACILNVSVNYFFADIPTSVGQRSPAHLRGKIGALAQGNQVDVRNIALAAELEELEAEDLRRLLQRFISVLTSQPEHRDASGVGNNGMSQASHLPKGETGAADPSDKIERSADLVT
jgi:transcriptional regulator with XRE-family HTH domain